jgi:hypothetical protein
LRERLLEVSVYPNPMRVGVLTLSLSGYDKTSAKGTVRIFSEKGTEIYSEKINCHLSYKRTLINIDENFKPGIYVVSVYIEDKIFSERLVIH